MSKIGKRAVSGVLAASVLLGGIAFAQSHISAATDAKVQNENATSAKAKADKTGRHGGKKGGFGDRGGMNLVQETATILGVEESAIRTELEAGKTFAQIAEAKSLTKAEYLAKLTEAETKAIDARVAAGSLTKEQADEKKAGLADRLAKAIESTKPAGGERGGHGGGFGRFGNSEKIAGLLGMTKEELKTALDSGKSLAEVAAAKGISEDQLIGKVKDSLTDSLKTYVNEKRPAKSAAKTE